MCNVDGSLKLSFTKSVMYLRSLTLHSQEKVEKTGFIQYHVPFPRTPYILTCIEQWDKCHQYLFNSEAVQVGEYRTHS